MTVNALHEAIIERLEEELNRMACFAAVSYTHLTLPTNSRV